MTGLLVTSLDRAFNLGRHLVEPLAAIVLGASALSAVLLGWLLPPFAILIGFVPLAVVARSFVFQEARRQYDLEHESAWRLAMTLAWRLLLLTITMPLAALLAAHLLSMGQFDLQRRLNQHLWAIPLPDPVMLSGSMVDNAVALAVTTDFYLLFPLAPLLLTVLFSVRTPMARRGIANAYADFPFLKTVLFVTFYTLFVAGLLYPRQGAGAVNHVTQGYGGAATLTILHTCVFVSLYWIAEILDIHARPRILPKVLLAAATVCSCLSISYFVAGNGPFWAGSRVALMWRLSLVPIIGILPVLAVRSVGRQPRVRTARRRRTRVSHSPAPPQWVRRRIGSVVRHVSALIQQMVIDIIRGQLVVSTIVQRHLHFFIIGLPLSAVFPPTTSSTFSLWFAATLGWVGPLMIGLAYINDTCANAYYDGLRRAIHHLREHVLILGYGDLGRRVSSELWEKKIVPYTSLFEHIGRSQNILLPNGTLAKVLLRLAAVEVDQSTLSHVARSPSGPTLGVHDISDVIAVTTEADRPSASIVIPVVIGDATAEEIQDYARLAAAGFVACTIRQRQTAEPAQRLLQRLESLANEGINVPAVLALYSSAYIQHVTERVMRTALPVHWILTSHLEGSNAANVAYASYAARSLAVRRRTEPQRPETILICGRGPRLIYFVDTIIKSAEKGAYNRSDAPAIVIMTGDDALAELVAPRTACIAPRPPVQATGAPPSEHHLQPETLRFYPLITRVPTGIDETSEYLRGKPYEVSVIRQDPASYQAVNAVIDRFRPDIVVILDYEAETEFRLMNYVFTNTYRRATDPSLTGEKLPLVFVSGETGKPYLQAYFRRGLAYYAGVRTSRVPAEQETGPGQGIDRSSRAHDLARGAPFVDVLDDPTARILALARAYLDKSPAKKRVVELHFCESDVPSAIVHRLAALSGRTFIAPPGSPAPLSLANTRFIPLAPVRERQTAVPDRKGAAVAPELKRFMIRSFVHWTEGLADDKAASRFHRLAVVSGHERTQRREENSDVDDARRIVSQMIRPLARDADSLLPEYVKILAGLEKAPLAHPDVETWLRDHRGPVENSLDDFREVAQKVVGQVEHCCGMLTCPVEAFHRCAEGRFLMPAYEMACDEMYINDRRRARAAANQFRHVREVATRLFVDKTEPASINGYKKTGLAHFRIDCAIEGSQQRPRIQINGQRWPAPRAGVLASIFAQLLLGRVEPHASARSDSLVDLTYLSSYECHDARFGVFSCYGKLIDESVEKVDDSYKIRSVIITPFYGDKWGGYAEDLAGHLSEHAGTGYQMRSVAGTSDRMGARFEVRPLG
jgi:hypothetical protein